MQVMDNVVFYYKLVIQFFKIATQLNIVYNMKLLKVVLALLVIALGYSIFALQEPIALLTDKFLNLVTYFVQKEFF